MPQQSGGRPSRDTELLRQMLTEREAQRRRVHELADLDGDSQDALVAAVAEVEIAHEELRVASEELSAQHAQIQDLLARLSDHRSWRERLSSRLDLPVLVSDDTGVVVEANAALARLLEVAVEHLVGKPFVVFLDEAGRRAWRLRDAVVHGAEGHLDVTLRPRRSEPVPVHLLGVGETTADGEPAVRWFVTVQHQRAVSQPRMHAVARALSELARLPVRHDGELAPLLRSVAALVQQALGPHCGASVTVGSPEAPELQATESAFAQAVDGAQLAAGEGPCLEAYSSQQVVVSPSVPQDPRWPRLAPLTVHTGLGGCVAVPLRSGTEAVGVLNVFLRSATPGGAVRPNSAEPADVQQDVQGRAPENEPANEPDGAEEDVEELAELVRLLADAAASVVVDVRELVSLRRFGDQMRDAMASRAAIEQAKGMLMAHLGCSADEAFQRLVAVSRNSNTKLRVLAELVTQDPSRLSALW